MTSALHPIDLAILAAFASVIVWGVVQHDRAVYAERMTQVYAAPLVECMNNVGFRSKSAIVTCIRTDIR